MLTEAVIRESLSRQILATCPRVEAVYEFWVPRSNERADIAVIGSTMDGLEIKTGRDTLKRLPRQAAAYERLFDRCYVVLAGRHVDEARDMLPEWWGITVVRGDNTPIFEQMREAGVNNTVDPETLVRLLWRNEVYETLRAFGAAPDPGAGRFRMWEELLNLVDLDQLKAAVRKALMHRDPSRARIPSQRFSLR